MASSGGYSADSASIKDNIDRIEGVISSANLDESTSALLNQTVSLIKHTARKISHESSSLSDRDQYLSRSVNLKSDLEVSESDSDGFKDPHDSTDETLDRDTYADKIRGARSSPTRYYTPNPREMRKRRITPPEGNSQKKDRQQTLESLSSDSDMETESDSRTVAKPHPFSNPNPEDQMSIIYHEVPKNMLCNPIKLAKCLNKAVPGIRIYDQKSYISTGKLILIFRDRNSYNKCNQAKFQGTELADCRKTIYQPPKKQKPNFVLITGLDPAIPEEEIGEELEGQGIKTTKVERLVHRPSGNQLFKVKVGLAKESDKQQMLKYGIRIGFSKHRVLEYFTQPDVRICFKCQAIGHFANSCRKEKICVRCGESHEGQTCTLARDEPKCFRCGGDHSSAYRGCPKIKEAQQELSRKTEMKKQANIMKSLIVPPSPPCPPAPTKLNIDEKTELLEQIATAQVDILFKILTQYITPPNRECQNRFLKGVCGSISEAFMSHLNLEINAEEMYHSSSNRLFDSTFV
jgi:hypothetical protein